MRPCRALPALGLEPVDQIDDVVEAAACAAADAAADDGNGEMGLAASSSASNTILAVKR
jgi:hypothetical protein